MRAYAIIRTTSRGNGQYYYATTFTLLRTYLRHRPRGVLLSIHVHGSAAYLKVFDDRRDSRIPADSCVDVGGEQLLLTITSFTGDPRLRARRGVVLSARVHPGESNSSWMMKVTIDF